MSDQQQQTSTTYLQAAADTARDAAVRALKERGIVRAEELVALSEPVAVLAWCRWWDSQHAVTPGLLVERIRSGEDAPRPVGSNVDLRRQERYLQSIIDWLRSKLPDLCVADPNGYPHPAAITTVIRLHYKVGKLTKANFPEIREAVRIFDERSERGLTDDDDTSPTREVVA